jgi:hypothetical protein
VEHPPSTAATSTPSDAQTPTVGGVQTTIVGGAKSTTVGGVQTTIVGGAKSTTVGGVQAPTVGLANAPTVGLANATTVGLAHSTTVGGAQGSDNSGKPIGKPMSSIELNHFKPDPSNGALTPTGGNSGETGTVVESGDTNLGNVKIINVEHTQPNALGGSQTPSSASSPSAPLLPYTNDTFVGEKVNAEIGGAEHEISTVSSSQTLSTSPSIQGKLDSMNDLSDQGSTPLQTTTRNYTQAVQTLSKIEKTIANEGETTVQNLKQ